MNRRRLVSLADVLEVTNERASDSGVDLVLSVTEKRGIIPQSAVFNKRVAVADLSKYKVLEPLDIAFNPYLVWAGAYSQWVGTQRGVVSPVYETFRVREGVDARFVGILLSSGLLTPYFDATAVGSVPRRRRTTVPVFLSAQIGLPEFGEQQRIVDLVGSVDGYIDSLQTQVEATRAARSALLAELLSNAGDDWRFARLGDVSTLQIGRTPPRGEAKYWSTDLERPFCTIADMYGRHCRPVREGVTELAEQEGKAKRMSAGTLLMSFKLTIGRVAFADCDLFPNEAIVSILPDRRVVTAEFLYYFLGSQDLTRESGQAVKGKTLNGASLRSIEVVLPSLEEQQEIVNLMDAVERQIESVDSQRDAALKLRSGVLSELLSGERLLDESYDVAVSL